MNTDEATKVKVVADYYKNGYLTVGKTYDISSNDGKYFWINKSDIGFGVFCAWKDCFHKYEYEPVFESQENQMTSYWDYMREGGQGDQEMNTVKVGSEWVCMKEDPWGAPLEPGDVAVIKSNNKGHITYWYDGDTWEAGIEGWYEYFLPLLNDSAKQDQVNHPSHYNESGVECIEAIRASLGPDGFQAYCKGNCMKYLWRYPYKNGLEDVKKAEVYLKWMVESMEGKEVD